LHPPAPSTEDARVPDPTAVPAGVLLAGSTAALGLPAGAAGWLSRAEQDRAAALVRASDRADYIAAHVLVRRCAGLLLGASPDRLTVVQHCPHCGRTGHGRPSLAQAPEVRLSLAHTRGYVAAAADTEDIAVDVERVPTPDRVSELAPAVLTPAELALLAGSADPGGTFARFWVRKEALVKLGLASLDTLAETDVSPALPDGASWRGYAVLGWSDPAGQVVGATVGRRQPELVRLLG
jgi:4'-phosphopantetheinyl transferase